MLYVVRREERDAAVVELELAVEAQVRGELLVCLDATGKPVQTYPVSGVLAYSTNDVVRRGLQNDGRGFSEAAS